jgi:hypothetical protein
VATRTEKTAERKLLEAQFVDTMQKALLMPQTTAAEMQAKWEALTEFTEKPWLFYLSGMNHGGTSDWDAAYKEEAKHVGALAEKAIKLLHVAYLKWYMKTYPNDPLVLKLFPNRGLKSQSKAFAVHAGTVDLIGNLILVQPKSKLDTGFGTAAYTLSPVPENAIEWLLTRPWPSPMAKTNQFAGPEEIADIEAVLAALA